MKTRSTFLAAVALALEASVAHAGTLVTAPQVYKTPASDVYCTVRNVSRTASVELKIEGRNQYGEFLSSLPTTLAPREGTSTLVPSASYCTFVVLSGRKRDLRAAAVFRDPSTSEYLAAVAAE